MFPKVLIFAEKKQDVDAIHEYLLLKNVEAVAIHGGKGTFFFIFSFMPINFMNYRYNVMGYSYNFLKQFSLFWSF